MTTATHVDEAPRRAAVMPLDPDAHPVDRHVGARIRLRRKDMGMSQTSLATAAGITFQQVQKYERAGNRVSASRLVELARALDVPVRFFFEGLPDADDLESVTDRTLREAIQSEPIRRIVLALVSMNGRARSNIADLCDLLAG